MNKLTRRLPRLLFPALYVLLYVLYMLYSSGNTQAVLLREKAVEIQHSIDMLAAGVDGAQGLSRHERERLVCDQVEHLDGLYQVYAGAFARFDGAYGLITERVYETSPFEPFDFAQFVEAVTLNDYGFMMIHYAPEDQGARDLHVYYRWMPSHAPREERLLVVGGVSKYSIVSQAPALVSISQVATIVAMVFMAGLLVVSDAKRERECERGDGE